MQPDVARAQAGTLREMAREWERDASLGVGGAINIAYLLRLSGKLIDKIANGDPLPDYQPEYPAHPVPADTTDTRDG